MARTGYWAARWIGAAAAVGLVVGCASLRTLSRRRAVTRTLVATGYCSCGTCCRWQRDSGGNPVDSATGRPKEVGTTASGTRARRGTIAADTARYPFGTVMWVPGYGYGTVEDRGADMRANRIDLFFSTHEQALNWGKRRVRAKIWFPE